jgi:hypothetical protein
MQDDIVALFAYDRWANQVAAKLKRFGIEQPATDFFFWVIEQTPQEVY